MKKALFCFLFMLIGLYDVQAFCFHQQIEKRTKWKDFFTRPHTSQGKGTEENINGVIRLFFPKKTGFNKICNDEITRVPNEIKNRPVQNFGCQTPNEVLLRLKGIVALTS